FMENIEFAFKVAARGIDSWFELPTHDAEWMLLKKAARVRNRLMHPKSSSDLAVSIDELHIVGTAFEWLVVQFGELIFSLNKPKPPEIEALYEEFQQRSRQRGFSKRVN